MKLDNIDMKEEKTTSIKIVDNGKLIDEIKDDKEPKEKKKHPVRNTFIIIFLILIGFVLYSRFISTSGLQIKEYGVYSEVLPKGFDGLKIIQFSDLHFGTTINEEETKRLVKEINELKPDIVVFTGDLIDRSLAVSDKHKEFLIETLKGIEAHLGKYAVSGNHDYEYDGYDDIMTGANFNVLNNENKLIYYNDEAPIMIAGSPSSIKSFQKYEEAFSGSDATPYIIFLSHEPDNIANITDYNVSLMLSGHSHGGQVRVPFIGSIAKINGARNYYDEHYTVNNTELYISYGLGTSGIPFRFLDKPSINLFRLYTK